MGLRPVDIRQASKQAVAIVCWNPACGAPKGTPRVLVRVYVEGRASLFQKCNKCGSYNIRTVEDGKLID